MLARERRPPSRWRAGHASCAAGSGAADPSERTHPIAIHPSRSPKRPLSRTLEINAAGERRLGGVRHEGVVVRRRPPPRPSRAPDVGSPRGAGGPAQRGRRSVRRARCRSPSVSHVGLVCLPAAGPRSRRRAPVLTFLISVFTSQFACCACPASPFSTRSPSKSEHLRAATSVNQIRSPSPLFGRCSRTFCKRGFALLFDRVIRMHTPVGGNRVEILYIFFLIPRHVWRILEVAGDHRAAVFPFTDRGGHVGEMRRPRPPTRPPDRLARSTPPASGSDPRARSHDSRSAPALFDIPSVTREVNRRN